MAFLKRNENSVAYLQKTVRDSALQLPLSILQLITRAWLNQKMMTALVITFKMLFLLHKSPNLIVLNKNILTTRETHLNNRKKKERKRNTLKYLLLFCCTHIQLEDFLLTDSMDQNHLYLNIPCFLCNIGNSICEEF